MQIIQARPSNMRNVKVFGLIVESTMYDVAPNV